MFINNSVHIQPSQNSYTPLEHSKPTTNTNLKVTTNLEHLDWWSQIFSFRHHKSQFIYFNLPFRNTPNINGSILLATSFKYFFNILPHLFLSPPLRLSLLRYKAFATTKSKKPTTKIQETHTQNQSPPPNPNPNPNQPPQNPRNPPPKSKKLTPKINHHHSQDPPNPWKRRDRENRKEKWEKKKKKKELVKKEKEKSKEMNQRKKERKKKKKEKDKPERKKKSVRRKRKREK